MLSLNSLPNNSGCYLFKDKNNKIIYVGKAKYIKKRVKQYFQKNDLDPKTQSMVKNISSVDFVVTNNELEAYILENALIKKHQPKYNIKLKDAKNHSYILLTDEEFPRVLIARSKIGKGKFYGPFVSAQDRDFILQFLKKTFLIRSCKNMPKKECLRYHINLCEAPCIGNISKEKYLEKIKNIKLILSGHIDKLTKKLSEEMKTYSNKNDFEYALKIRDELAAIGYLKEKQNIQRVKKYNEDIINYRIKDDKVYLILFNIYKGILSNKSEFIFDYNPNFLEEFIIQYYSDNIVPKELIVSKKLSNSISKFLSQKKQGIVKITHPEKGQKKQLLDLVEKNIEISFFSDINKVEALKNKLNLQDLPNIIECFDISHLSGSSTAGSMVQYRNGKPYKNNYRRFKIRTVSGINDTSSIAEVVKRRYTHLKLQEPSYPDLIIIDGGRGQLNFAIQELNKLGLKIPIIAIAKQFEEIYIPGIIQPLRLSKKDKALQFIQEIRNEAHRFAVKYNRFLRKKEIYHE